ncbi:MAG: T9SS type A sorting domain-containing protein [Taibaiella sp.]|jgi:hypothetical protein
MKMLSKILLGVVMLSPQWSEAKGNANDTPLFKENKGQLVDQNSKLRPDIHYYGNSDGLSYFFKNTGISYQLYGKGKKENEFLISRVDMTWLGANTNAKVITKNTSTATDNFYNTPDSKGITGVRGFGDLKYEGIYNGIDLHYYYKNGSLKYDFIVAPGTDYENIKIKVEGASSITQNKDGSISIVTPLGILTEAMPVAFQNGKEVEASWILEDNVLSFQVAEYDHALPLVIDPLVYQWMGGDSDQTESAIWTTIANFYRNVPDAHGNLYVARNRFSSGYGNLTKLYKYNSSGNLTWTTLLSTFLFGDETNVAGLSIYGNNIYISGEGGTNATIATTGAYQTTATGQRDGFLMKYDSSGARIWGTFYGGSANDIIKSCKVDSVGYIYICGTTQSTGNMSSIGAEQSSLAGLADGFVAKFNTGNGYRAWGTYFGGSNIDSAKSIDVYGNRLYIAGITKSTSGIATSGAHQTAFSGNINGFLLCMDTSGVTQWSTYYGTDSTMAERCVTNGSSIYLSGSTNATGSIATTGTYQPTNAGGFDGFLAKFNLSGVQQWGTYYGGTARDFAWGSALGSNGNIYISGNTKSTTGMTTPNSYNPTYVVGQYYINGQHVGVAYLAELDTNGQRISGTYFNAGSSAEWCSVNNSGDVFISGLYAYIYSDYKPFVAKFGYCNTATPAITASALNICPNTTSQLSTPAVTGATYQWYRNGTPISGATSNVYNASLAGDYTLTLDQCASAVSSVITLTTSPVPTTQITETNAPCANATNGSITVTPSGGTAPYSYVWDNSTNTTATLSGLIPGSYIVHTSDANTCTKTDTVTILNTNNSPSSQTSHTSVPCYGDSVATISVITTGGTVPYTYSWDNLTATTPYLDGLNTGTYVVHTSDSNGCADIDTVIIGQDTVMQPSDPLASICAVTVDSATGKNIILWQKTGIVKATAYKIYRESTVAGQYDLIGTNDVNDNTTFLDITSVPLQQSYSYKIAEVDSCDHEWPMSDLHKTIHLSANVGINGEINLLWNLYEGKPYTTHRIMRSFNGGAFALLNEVSSTITAYSDLTPPIGNSVYRIQIDLGAVCDSLNTQYVTSNKLSLNTTGINDVPGINTIQIVPNPTTGIINILGDEPAKIRLYDVVGRLLQEEKNTSKMDISKYAKGIFMIHLYNKQGELYHSQKVVLK